MDQDTNSIALNKLLKQLQNVHGHHPEAEFVVKFVNAQRTECKLTEKELYDQVVSHLVSNSMSSHSQVIREFNSKISDGIVGLTRFKEWPNLDKVARHAFSSYLDLLEKEDEVIDIVPGVRFRNRILNAGEDQFITIIAEYFTAINKGDELIAAIKENA